MLAGIVVLLLTWLTIGSLVCILSDLPWKAAMTQPGTLAFMVIFGWIPAVIVGSDIDENYG